MEIEEKVAQQTLIDVMRSDRSGYLLRFGYRLELLAGGFAKGTAITVSRGNTREIDVVYTDDISVLEELWNILPNNASKVAAVLYYGNPELNRWFVLSDGLLMNEDYKTAEPFTFLSREKFDELLKIETHKFKWSASVISRSDPSKQEWSKYIAKKIKELKEQYT